MARQEEPAPEVVGMDLTDATDAFEIVGVSPPADLTLYGGDEVLGEITYDMFDSMNFWDLPPYVEAPIKPFQTRCDLPPTAPIEDGALLAKVPLTTGDFSVTDKSADLEMAVATKGSGSDQRLCRKRQLLPCRKRRQLQHV